MMRSDDRGSGILCLGKSLRAVVCGLPIKKHFSLLVLLAGVFTAAHSQNAGNYSNRATSPVSVRDDDSEIIATGAGSFGHVHIFANSWWSNLDQIGVEYDRHSWGYAAGARMDYSASFEPAMLLWQPSKTDEWGNPNSKSHQFVYGVGIAPIGLRMTWRSHKNIRPYFLVQGGMAGFDKKAFSQYASYVNFSLHMEPGVQFKVANRWDGRIGFSYYHISDAFIVPSNPGLDSMMYSCGIAYHLRDRH